MYQPSWILVYLRLSAYLTVGFVSVMFLLSDDDELLRKKTRTFLLSKLTICGILLVSATLTLFGLDSDLVRDAWLTPSSIVWAIVTLYFNLRKEIDKSDKIEP